MSSINGYKNSVDMDEEIISEVEDKTEENIYEQHWIKQIENTEVTIRKKIFKIEHWRWRKKFKKKPMSMGNMWVNLK